MSPADENDAGLTDEERRAITALHRLAKRWPQTLKLFSWSGSLCVMRVGVSPSNDAILTSISGIPNDGGDP
jgi:hypothetical protein